MGPAMLLGIDWDPDWNFEYDDRRFCLVGCYQRLRSPAIFRIRRNTLTISRKMSQA